MRRRRQLSIDDHVEGVLAGDRAILGRTLTLVESSRTEHIEQAQAVLHALLPHTGTAHRVGITGVPGVGKSTLLERLGLDLLDRGHRVAVLAIDPTSRRSGGSILGDKTRMVGLSSDPRAFVRPSPTGGTLGGVHRRTRESLLVCEAAGYDVVLIETVGVGQSETAVSDMVDSFVVLMLAGAGDGLQGIKRGILELAEVIAVNKADGDNAPKAMRARSEYARALRLVRPTSAHWRTPVRTCSGQTGAGVAELWDTIQQHRAALDTAGALVEKRADQRRRWLHSMLQEGLLAAVRSHPAVQAIQADVEREVVDGRMTAARGAWRLLAAAGLTVPDPWAHRGVLWAGWVQGAVGRSE